MAYFVYNIQWFLLCVIVPLSYFSIDAVREFLLSIIMMQTLFFEKDFEKLPLR
jgi:hypothetical protein